MKRSKIIFHRVPHVQRPMPSGIEMWMQVVILEEHEDIALVKFADGAKFRVSYNRIKYRLDREYL